MDWEVINTFCALVITVFMGLFAWESSKLVDESKKRDHERNKSKK